MKVELIGAVCICGKWDSDLILTDEQVEVFQSVGELVGIFEPPLEKLMLSLAWKSGNEAEVKLNEGSGYL